MTMLARPRAALHPLMLLVGWVENGWNATEAKVFFALGTTVASEIAKLRFPGAGTIPICRRSRATKSRPESTLAQECIRSSMLLERATLLPER
jgi:hypothetical protein